MFKINLTNVRGLNTDSIPFVDTNKISYTCRFKKNSQIALNNIENFQTSEVRNLEVHNKVTNKKD